MTTSGRTRTLLLLLGTAALLCSSRPACGGNLEMVEKNVEELENVNRQALGQIPHLPRDGRIDLKAYVTVDEGKSRIRIDESGTRIRSSKGEESRGTAVDVSAPAAEERIEFLENNSTPATKAAPGGKNVR